MFHRELLVNGNLVGGPCDGTVPKEVSRNPWSGATVGSYAEATWAHCDAALDGATNAFASWSRTPISDRRRLLRDISNALGEKRADFAELLVHEVGKPISWARAEVDRAALTFALAADHPVELDTPDLSRDPRATNYRATVHRKPRGVVLAFTPSNWPLNLAAHKIAPALLAGNTVVIKGSDQSALCTLSLARLIHQCGCPAGVVNAVQPLIVDAQRMVADRRVRHISFTGSAAVGWTIRERRFDIPVTLELGGNAFAIVLDDADPEATARILATSAYGFAGQVCISAQHVLATPAVYASLRQALTMATASMKVQDPAEDSTVCGPLLIEQASERVEAWVAESNGRILAGGPRMRNRMTPTLVEIDDFESAQARGEKLATEEVFGPVLTISPVPDFETALRLVNRSQYGIHAALFTDDRAAMDHAAQHLTAGGLVVNDAPSVRFDALPYGGEKRSGFGREGIASAYDDFTVPFSVVERIS